MSDNPFQAPVIAEHSSQSQQGDASQRVALMLKQTKPWVRFMSVMTFIGSAIMLLGAGFLFIMMTMVRIPGGNSEMAYVAVMYIVMGFLYIVPGIFMWQYASRIGVYLHSPNSSKLANALESQKAFWRFLGICTLVMLILFGVMFVGSILMGLAAATRAF